MNTAQIHPGRLPPGLVLLGVAAALVGCGRFEDHEHGVRLMHPGEPLEPTTTLEVRFDEPAIEDAQVGQPGLASPLRITPPWPGTWTWSSRRSGVFRPLEPPALDQTYRVSLTHGRARLRRALRTPPFDFHCESPRGAELHNASSTPRLVLYFNADVDAASVGNAFVFHDAAGHRVPAEVRPATRADHRGWVGPEEGPYATWQRRFANERPAIPSRRDSPADGAADAVPAPEPENLPHVWVVNPVHPLPLGSNWVLRVRAGLAATIPGLRLRQDRVVPLGHVIPFAATNFTAGNGLNAGRYLEIRFSKRLSPELTSTGVLDWIQIEPLPGRLAATLGDQTITLTADFALEDRYTVTVKAGLPAREPMTQTAAVQRPIAFAPSSPRLYFPSADTEQLSEGRRAFELVSVNVPELRVRARLLDRHTLVHALRGYRSYFRTDFWQEETYEPYREVDFNVLPGLALPNRTVVLPAGRDEATRSTIAWDDLLGGRRPAAVFLEAAASSADAQGRRPGTQALVQLTDLGLFWKRTDSNLWAWAFSYHTGQPLPGTTLRLVTDDNEVLAEAVAGSEGGTMFPLSPNAAWLMAEHGDDLRAAELRRHALYVDASDIPRRYDWSGPEPTRQLLFFSERPVYRPGETVHLKAIVRDREGEALAIPAELTGQFTVHDARNRKLEEADATFSALGSWQADVALPAQGRGTFRAELRLGTNEVYAHHFQVQDYQPDAFDLTLPAPAAFAAGEAFACPVRAHYRFGDEVSRGTVRWTLRAEDEGFAPAGFEAFAFCSQVWLAGSPYRSQSWTAEGQTNYVRGTSLVLDSAVPLHATAPQPRAVELRVELTDLNQQTLARGARSVLHSSAFYLGVRVAKGLPQAEQPWPLEIVAVDPAGQPIAESVPVRVRLERIDWRTVRQQGAGGSLNYRSEPEYVQVDEQDVATQTPVWTGRRWEIPAGTPPAATLTAPTAGSYLLEARARDAADREVVTALIVYVSGAGIAAWDYRSPAVLELVPDRTNYVVGDTAQVLVRAPFSGAAVVTLERDRVMRSFLTQLTGNAPAVAVPLTIDDAPAVYVSVMLLRGITHSPRTLPEPEYALGYCQLNVRRPETRLEVALTLAAAEVRPAQPVAIAALVQDGTGAPAGDAEVTLYAVDEGVLSLLGYEAPDPAGFFHAVRPLAVWSHGTLPALLPEDPALWQFHNKGFLVGGGGKSRSALRQDFRACAFWNATLRTDAAGRLAVEFPAPDSLTEYRVVAVAHTARHQFGTGTATFRVNQPLQLEPALPAFANLGDRLQARAVLHNRTALDGVIEVALELDEHAAFAPTNGTETPSPRRLRLPAGTTTTVEFPVAFKQAGPARWIWRAQWIEPAGEAFQDAVVARLTVNDPAPLLREVHLTRSVTPRTNLLARADPQLLEGAREREVAVRISNTRLGELGGALTHLLQYPYGCAEQTISSLLPWLALADFPPHHTELARPRDDARVAIERGVHRLLSLQTDDGGLAYWPGSRTSLLWVSAYGGMALALAERQGVSLPADAMNRLYRHLRNALVSAPGASLPDQEALSARVLALWALTLAGRPEEAHAEALFAQRARMSLETRAVLALSCATSARDQAIALLEPERGLPAPEDLWFGGAARERAIQLLAWCRVEPDRAEVDRLLEELLALRQDGHWRTTQGNAWALLALAEYARQVEGERTAVAGTLVWGEERVAFELPAAPHTFETTFRGVPTATETPLWLEHPASQRLFVQTTVSGRAREVAPPAQDRGFALQRRYDLVADDGSVREFAQARVGDRVLVSLRLEVRQPAYFLALDDPLPAVFEPLQPEFTSRQAAAGSELTADWISDFRELRADRALFFCDRLAPGHYTVRYLARVRAAGQALAPAAKVEAMYHPERFGLTATQRLETFAAE
jgi:uncharacterized protein YfaS (alpha-2-macroglobulin family)